MNETRLLLSGLKTCIVTMSLWVVLARSLGAFHALVLQLPYHFCFFFSFLVFFFRYSCSGKDIGGVGMVLLLFACLVNVRI